MEDLKTENKEVECCPICFGRGYVPEGFYNSMGTTWVSDGSGTEVCRSCNGRGYIVI